MDKERFERREFFGFLLQYDVAVFEKTGPRTAKQPSRVPAPH